MKIAILTSARSGSTSLFRLIEETLSGKNYFCISEPFNRYWRDSVGLKTFDIDFFENKKNVFIKTFISANQIPSSFVHDQQLYWEWFHGYFDKVILLDRKNKDLQSESLSYLRNKGSFWDWQKKQYYDLNLVNENELSNTKEMLISESKLIHSMSDLYPLVYFEDIYIKKNKNVILGILKYLDLELKEVLYQKYVESDLQRIRLTEDEVKIKKLI